MRAAILQSNYFPWRGYFSLINSVDLFIFHDDLQYTKNDWRNRNRFRQPSGEINWLTIPCGTSEKRQICEVLLPNSKWEEGHFKKLTNWYRKSPGWNNYEQLLSEIFIGNEFLLLSDFNQHWIQKISREIFNSKTEFIDSRKLELKETKERRVLEILDKVGAKKYLSGPAGKNYLENSHFAEAGITLEYADYTRLPILTENEGQDSLSILHNLMMEPDHTRILGAL